MKFKVRPISIKTGDLIALVHINDAISLDIYPQDRILIRKGSKKITAIVDVARDKELVKPGEVGLFKEVSDLLGVKKGSAVNIKVGEKPVSVGFIKQKLEGKELSEIKMRNIINDIGANKLSKAEITYFVASCYLNGLSLKETVALTKSMYESGNTLKPKSKRVFDKHCIGGLPGNRTTPLVVPICAAAGLTIPKTSSRSITSPAGTADTMEVLANVTIPIKKMKKIVDKVNACIVWGGALNLAPADDEIIEVEHPLSLDAEGQLLASIMAKKLSVSSTDILIDIPVANDAKVDKKTGLRLKKKFLDLAKKFKVNMRVIITDGRQPIGNGIGPALEARDILWIYEKDLRAPEDLKQKALQVAGELLEMAGTVPKGNGHILAGKILNSGKAYKKFLQIIKEQGAKITKSSEIPIAKFKFNYKSDNAGKVFDIDNNLVSAIAKGAGAPIDKSAGMYLRKHIGDNVEQGDILFTIYSNSKRKLKYARNLLQKNPVFIRTKKQKPRKPKKLKREETFTRYIADWKAGVTD
ncbi:AMP phosphorylase [Candidatus Woesearchaeota archaeon]|nr:AMP phosphorylase [Candidatus Woesearchaeota archaeon]